MVLVWVPLEVEPLVLLVPQLSLVVVLHLPVHCSVQRLLPLWRRPHPQPILLVSSPLMLVAFVCVSSSAAPLRLDPKAHP